MNLKSILIGLTALAGCYLPPETQPRAEVRIVYVYQDVPRYYNGSMGCMVNIDNCAPYGHSYVGSRYGRPIFVPSNQQRRYEPQRTEFKRFEPRRNPHEPRKPEPKPEGYRKFEPQGRPEPPRKP